MKLCCLFVCRVSCVNKLFFTVSDVYVYETLLVVKTVSCVNEICFTVFDVNETL